MIYLPDVNVWIALISDKHVHHVVARTWFRGIQQTDEVVFCRITEMGFLRLLTNRRVMGEDAVNPKAAWKIYDILCADRQITFLNESPQFPEKWREASEQATGGPNVWTDAYLSAFVAAHGAKLVTFDRALGTRTGAELLVI
jgi:toxin-antitoxin system PIN domain toxin